MTLVHFNILLSGVPPAFKISFHAELCQRIIQSDNTWEKALQTIPVLYQTAAERVCGF